MSEVVLHQWEISPFCRKIRMILAHKGIPFRTVEYNGLRAAGARKLSGPGKLPVLDYDGDRVQDSTAIFEALEKRHPTPPLLPSDPGERALAELLEDWADEALYFLEVYLRFKIPEVRPKALDLLCAGRPAWERAVFGSVATRVTMKKLDLQGTGKLSRERAEATFLAHLGRIEALLGGRDFLVGSACSIADIAVGAQLAEIRRTSHLAPEMEARAGLTAWLARLPSG